MHDLNFTKQDPYCAKKCIALIARPWRMTTSKSDTVLQPLEYVIYTFCLVYGGSDAKYLKRQAVQHVKHRDLD